MYFHVDKRMNININISSFQIIKCTIVRVALKKHLIGWEAKVLPPGDYSGYKCNKYKHQTAKQPKPVLQYLWF